jgi:hypothetical protein
VAKSKMPNEKPGKGGNEEPPKRDDDNEKGTPPGNPNADPVRIHRDFVERRLTGGAGARATQPDYERALKEWHRLPGALVTSPTEIRADDAKAEAEKKKDADQREDAGLERKP